MTREIIKPDNHMHWLNLRMKDITSTESSALFGLSPYCTKAELWYRKKDNLRVDFEENMRMKWGSRLESTIAAGIAEDSGWQIRPMKEYIRLPQLKMGSSFDYAILSGNGVDFGLLEIKNVDSLQFKEKWIVDGDDIEAPPHIEIQVQHQMFVSGLSVAYIGAFVGGNNVVLIKRDRDDALIEKIKFSVLNFWNSIECGVPPDFDFERDADFISKLYSHAEPGKVIESTDRMADLARAYKAAADKMKLAEKEKDAAKAELLTLIGAAEKVSGSNFTISSGIIGPASVSFERQAYRNFKINWRKEK